LKGCFETLKGLHIIQEGERKEEIKKEMITDAEQKVIQPHTPPRHGGVI
jgi:hypothetical protein